MCIAQFNLYLVVLVVAILPITRPAIASHNLARFNPGIEQTQSRNPGDWQNGPGLHSLRALYFIFPYLPMKHVVSRDKMGINGHLTTFSLTRSDIK